MKPKLEELLKIPKNIFVFEGLKAGEESQFEDLDKNLTAFFNYFDYDLFKINKAISKINYEFAKKVLKEAWKVTARTMSYEDYLSLTEIGTIDEPYCQKKFGPDFKEMPKDWGVYKNVLKSYGIDDIDDYEKFILEYYTKPK